MAVRQEADVFEPALAPPCVCWGSTCFPVASVFITHWMRETWAPVYRYLRKGGVPMKCNHLNFEWGTLQWITAMNVASEWILEWLLRVIERKRKTLGSIFIRLCDTFLHVDSLPHSRIPLAGIQKLTRMCGKEIVLHRQTYGNQETWFLFSQPQIHEITQSWLSVT